MANDSPFELRLSSAASWVRCAAYPMMNRTPQALKLEDEGDHTLREEGTAMHWAAEQLRHGYLLTTDLIAPNGVALTDELIDGAEMYVDVLRGDGIGWYIERTLPARRIHPKCGGTPDAYNLYESDDVSIRIVDLKGGCRFVKAFPNWQLFGYLAAILDEHSLCYDIDELVVEFVIVQPRAYCKEGPVRRHRVTIRDARPYIESLRMAAHIAMGDHAKAIAGPQCDDCNARAGCGVCHEAGLRAVDVSGEPDVYDLPDAALDYEMMRLEEARDIINARLTGLQAQAAANIRRGSLLPHYALEAGAGRLNWLDEDAERAALLVGELMGVDLSKPVRAITPTQAMKFLPRELVESYAERKRGEVKLVRFDGNAAVKAFSHLKGK